MKQNENKGKFSFQKVHKTFSKKVIEKNGRLDKKSELNTFSKNSLFIDIIILVFSIGISLSAGAIGSIFTIQYIPTWYATLTKPFFAPPNWLFGPAWTTLYILMGISLFLILRKRNFFEKMNKIAIGFFGIQLVLNTLWSFLFFALQNPFYGLIGIIFLWFSILGTIIAFYPISKKAAYLLTPYILWVSFASILNASIWLLNP